MNHRDIPCSYVLLCEIVMEQYFFFVCRSNLLQRQTSQPFPSRALSTIFNSPAWARVLGEHWLPRSSSTPHVPFKVVPSVSQPPYRCERDPRYALSSTTTVSSPYPSHTKQSRGGDNATPSVNRNNSLLYSNYILDTFKMVWQSWKYIIYWISFTIEKFAPWVTW